ncbi:MAG: fimbria/pilus periplasmic chaperone [Chania sp.]
MYKTRTDFIRILISTAVAVVFSLTSTAAVAIGLQVSPISIDLLDNANATELWLINSSAKPMQVQVRVYQWEQKNNKDILTATSNLIVSPPVAKVAANGRQLVRVMRPKGDDNTSPLSMFRILVNELPVASTKNTGVDFVMEYSIPAFIYKNKPDSLQTKLSLSLSSNGKTTLLRANNQGDLYGRLYALNFIDSKGKRQVLNSGLVGYVLPHQEMQWDIGKPPSAFAQGGTMEVLLNGKTHSETIAPLGR